MKDEEDILRFLTHAMSDSESKAFEQRMILEPELEEAVEHSRRIKNILDQGTVDFAKEVRSVIQSNKKKNRRPWMIAASIAIVFLATALYLTVYVPDRGSEISYLEPYPDVLTSRSEESTIDLSAYNSGAYQDAIKLLEEAFTEDKKPVIALYLGVSYLMIDDGENAMNAFESVSFENTVFEEDFLWYEGLALIKMGKVEEAKKKLGRLNDGNSFYKKRANELLDDLE